jgi:DnaK suppressor protein
MDRKYAISKRARIHTRHWHDECEERGQPDREGGRSMRSIKGELELKRDALSNAIQESMDSTRDADQRRDVNKDPYGSASLTHDDEVTAAVVDRRARQLEEVNRALEDIDAGRYGVCRECGNEIPPARLKVMPFATRCVACQASLETARRAA